MKKRKKKKMKEGNESRKLFLILITRNIFFFFLEIIFRIGIKWIFVDIHYCNSVHWEGSPGVNNSKVLFYVKFNGVEKQLLLI